MDEILLILPIFAALAALLTFRRPECTLGGEDGHKVIIHPPEVREPLPLIIHHLPITVTFAFFGNETMVVDTYNSERAVQKIKCHSSVAILDVKETGSKLQEMQTRSVDLEGVSGLSGHHMERLNLMSEEGSVNQRNDMEIERQ